MNEVIDDLVSLYAEETAFLWTRRTSATHAADYRLTDLAQLDDRLDAYLEALHVSGISGWHHCEKGLERQEPGEAFAAAAIALETCDQGRIEKVFATLDPAPQMLIGVASAFGWVPPTSLKATVSGLLRSQHPLRRFIGLSACAMHGVDPGLGSARWLEDPHPLVRARAFRAAGKLARWTLLPQCISALGDADPDCRFWAAWSSVLLGNRDSGLEALLRTAATDGPHRARAFRLALQAMRLGHAHKWLKSFAADTQNLRLLIQGCGVVGDPTYVPWLISHLRIENTARIAGEAITLITGADLRESELGGKQPADFHSGPNDDPDDADVDMDPDDALPWPNVSRMEAWWAANTNRFAQGTRYFIGAPVTREQCVAVLRNGYQQQRMLAAQHLCLLEPGTQLFNTSAPVWRQRKVLAGIK